MESVELRPLSLGELLDRTFSLYRRHFWVFVGIMAIPCSFAIPFNLFFFAKQGSAVTPPVGTFPSPAAMPSAAQIGSIAGVFAAIFSFLIIFWLAYSLAMGATAYAVSQSYLGQVATVRESYRKVSHKVWRLLGVTINVILRMMGFGVLIFSVAGGIFAGAAFGMAALGPGVGARIAVAIVMVVAGALAYLGGIALLVYLALRYTVSIPVLMLENVGVLESIRRSVYLTKGRRGQIFVAFLLAALLGYVGAIVFQGPFLIPMMIAMIHNSPPPAWLAFLTAVSGALGASITGPISIIVLVLCYYDARIRKEAFDLQFMMSTLDKPASAAEALSPPEAI